MIGKFSAFYTKSQKSDSSTKDIVSFMILSKDSILGSFCSTLVNSLITLARNSSKLAAMNMKIYLSPSFTANSYAAGTL